MRYGSPSIDQALDQLKAEESDEILVAPLFPQYASATSESCFLEAEKIFRRRNLKAKLKRLPAFYADSDYISSWKENVDLKKLAEADHILFSYHGLPVSQIKAADKSGAYCLKQNDCCLKASPHNQNCYRHHCVINTKLLAQALNLSPEKYSLAFQSRLGTAEWLQPYAQLEMEKLAKSGVKKLVVFCPSFVADCLETLEEIGLRLAHDFKSLGGEELSLVLSLNASDLWAVSFARILQKSLNL